MHCPAVTAPIRALDERAARLRKQAAGRRAQAASSAARAADRGVLRHGRHAAVVQRHRDLPLDAAARARRPPSGSASSAGSRPRLPSLVQAERRERSAFLRAIYREYDGARLADLDAVVDEHPRPTTCCRGSRPAAVRRIREHRAAGHRTVLITGAIRPLTRPLRAAVRPHRGRRARRRRPRASAPASSPRSPLVGESRAAWMRALRRRARHRPGGVLRLRRLATPTCRCSRRSATRSRSGPTCRCSGTPGAQRWTIVDWASSDRHRPRPSTRQGGAPMMLALEMFRSLPRHRGRQGDRRPDARHPVRATPRRCGWSPSTSRKVDRPGWARLRTRLSGICGSDLGALSGHDQPLLLRPSCRCRSCPATRSSPSCSTTARTCRPAPASWSTRCSPAPPAASSRARPARPAPPTGAPGSPSATSRPACRPASARTPAAAGASSSSRTAASCTSCPRATPTSRRC